MERRHVNAVSGVSPADVGQCNRREEFIQLTKTDTSYRVDKAISREGTPQEKRTLWTKRTSHAWRVKEGWDVMDQKCPKGFEESNKEWRLQDIEPVCRRQGDNQGWRKDWQSNRVLRRKTPSAASQWAQDIPVQYKPYAQPWASWNSDNYCKNNTKILDPEGEQAH